VHIKDLNNRFIIPGFIDVHFHVGRQECEEVMGTLLAFGITTIRDPGSLAGLKFNLKLKEKLSLGEIIGPRLLTSGRIINRHNNDGNWSFVRPCSTKGDMRKEVRNQIQQGADFIKVFIHLPPDLVEVAIDEAHASDRKVIGHLGVTSWSQAAKMGIDDLCHFHFLGPVWELSSKSRVSEFAELYYPSPKPDLYISTFRSWYETVDLNGPEMKNLVSLLKENEVFVTPTFVAVEVQVWGDNSEIRELYEPDFAPKKIADRWRSIERHPNTSSWTQEYFEEFRAAWSLSSEIIKIMHQNGVRLTAGTDHILAWITPGVTFHRELELLVKAGIPEIDVLTIATRNGAQNLGIFKETGTVEEGKMADLIVLTKNPIQDIRNTRSIEFVIKEGHVYQPNELLE
jgi:hypothetical protein